MHKAHHAVSVLTGHKLRQVTRWKTLFRNTPWKVSTKIRAEPRVGGGGGGREKAHLPPLMYRSLVESRGAALPSNLGRPGEPFTFFQHMEPNFTPHALKPFDHA